MGVYEQAVATNVPAIIMAVIFLYYINKRDMYMQKTLDKLADAISALERRIHNIESSHKKEK